jgi:hypothetical protein
MAIESDKTEVHTADNLQPAAKEDQKSAELQGYSVNIQGIIYSVKASNAEEAGEKAKELHNKTKGKKS